MAVNLIVAVTDENWFGTLRIQPDLTEVNFWAPAASPFRALTPGELILFKLRAPHNVIVGGGVFAHTTEMPCSIAWNAFGITNGANSLREMRERIAKYRSIRTDPNSPLKKALLTGFHSTAKHNATKAVSPSSETMRTI